MRLIDADELLESIEETTWYHIFKGKLIQGANGETDIPLYKASDIYSVLDAAPTVDAEPVVRCEDCQHSNLNGHCMEVGKKYCTIHKRQFHYDFFCSYGERKG